jgi:hypothetical protein
MAWRGAHRVLVLLLILACSAERAAADVAPVEVHDGRVHAHFASVPLRDAVIALANVEGASVVGNLDGDVTVDLDVASVEEALGRLLAARSFILVYGASGHLRRVQLLGSGMPTETVDRRGAVRADVEPGQPGSQGVLDIEVGLPPSSPLAVRLGSSQATLRDLVNLATRDEDATVRSKALDAGIQMIETNPRVQDAVATFLGSTDQEALAARIRSAAGPRADELVRWALQRSAPPETRSRLAAVARALRSQR